MYLNSQGILKLQLHAIMFFRQFSEECSSIVVFSFLNCFIFSNCQEFLQISSGIGQNSALGAGPQSKDYVKDDINKGSNVLDSNEEQIRIDKSNILLLGPTGSGKTRIFSILSQCVGNKLSKWRKQKHVST